MFLVLYAINQNKRAPNVILFLVLQAIKQNKRASNTTDSSLDKP